MSTEQLEGRNVIIEALRREKRRVLALWVDERARPDAKITEILNVAQSRRITLHRVSRDVLDEKSVTGVHNGVIARAVCLKSWTITELLDDLFARGETPFLVLADELQYEQNLGAILRSAMGAGVHALIIPKVRGKGLTPVVHRVAMGGAEEVPIIRDGLSSALKHIKKAGISIVGADMDGEPLWDVPLSGGIAMILGGESKGLSPTLRNKCNRVVSIPLCNNLDSLNVSVTAGVLFFERRRQTR